FNRLVVIRVQAGKYSASPDNKNTYEASFAKRMILHIPVIASEAG
ncbi:uncharacterized protein METZ01_LOCUS232781, partial [marine metagenome]